MGTNYYLYKDVCPVCKRGDDPLHIGKSSAGWCFGLHVYPEASWETEQVIEGLDAWKALWAQEGSIIKDEYGDIVTAEQMENIVTKRSTTHTYPDMFYKTAEEFYEENHAAPGPNGLARHRIDGRFCIGHGEGTWDLLVGEYS